MAYTRLVWTLGHDMREGTLSDVVRLRMHASMLSCIDRSIHLPSIDFVQDDRSHEEGSAVPNTASSSNAKWKISIHSSAGSSATMSIIADEGRKKGYSTQNKTRFR